MGRSRARVHPTRGRGNAERIFMGGQEEDPWSKRAAGAALECFDQGSSSCSLKSFGETFPTPGLRWWMRVRIRWSQAGLALLGVAAVLLALRVAPSFLKPPAPAPLPADVGLPRIEAAGGPAGDRDTGGTRARRRPDGGTMRNVERVAPGRAALAGPGGCGGQGTEACARSVPAPGAARRAAEGSPPRRQDPRANPPVPSPVPPLPEVPPPAPEPPPEPTPTPPPPDDGSMEFAPH
jgi:hypothetical protein